MAATWLKVIWDGSGSHSVGTWGPTFVCQNQLLTCNTPGHEETHSCFGTVAQQHKNWEPKSLQTTCVTGEVPAP